MNRPLVLLLVTGLAFGCNFPLGKLAVQAGVNPALWGALICVLVVLAMLPSAAGLLFIGPWLGFASWHAYRKAVHVTEVVSA